jgi:hypothetical protein
MLGASVRRGLVAGLLAGLLAALFGFVVGEPAIDAAIAIEEQAAGADAHDATTVEVTRPQQRAGLVLATVLLGLALGPLFGVAAAWSVGRLAGDAWVRSLKLGAVAVAALVVLPALKYPPNPPAVGDPATVGARTTLYLGLGVCGLLLAVAAWTSGRHLRAVLPAPVRQAAIGAGVLVVVGLLLALLPPAEGAAAFPADLLWDFRLRSLGTQVALHGGLAVAFGLLGARAERAAPAAVR